MQDKTRDPLDSAEVLPRQERLRRLFAEALTPEELQDLRRSLTVEDLLPCLSVEEIRKIVPAEERLKGLSAEEICKIVPAEELDRLRALLNR